MPTYYTGVLNSEYRELIRIYDILYGGTRQKNAF